MSMFLILPVLVWLAVAVILYTGLWFAFMRRSEMMGTSLFNLGISAVMSPGIWVAGHGAIPFPGGVQFLFGSPGEGAGATPVLNFAMWMLTFLIFSVYGRYLKNS